MDTKSSDGADDPDEHRQGTARADRTAVLAKLGDHIRLIQDPDDRAYAAAELLGQTLQVSRAVHGTIDTLAETITIERDWNAPGIVSLAGVLHFRDYGSYMRTSSAASGLPAHRRHADHRDRQCVDR